MKKFNFISLYKKQTWFLQNSPFYFLISVDFPLFSCFQILHRSEYNLEPFYKYNYLLFENFAGLSNINSQFKF